MYSCMSTIYHLQAIHTKFTWPPLATSKNKNTCKFKITISSAGFPIIYAKKLWARDCLCWTENPARLLCMLGKIPRLWHSCHGWYTIEMTGSTLSKGKASITKRCLSCGFNGLT